MKIRRSRRESVVYLGKRENGRLVKKKGLATQRKPSREYVYGYVPGGYVPRKRR